MTYGRPSMTTHLETIPLPGMLDLETRQDTEGPSLVSFYISTIELYSILDRILSDVYKAWRGRTKEPTQELKQPGPGLDLVIQIEDQLLRYQVGVPPHLNWSTSYALRSEFSNHSTIQRQRNVLHLRHILLYRPIFTQLCFGQQPDELLYTNPDSLHSFMLLKCASGCIQAAINLISLVHKTHKTSTADTWWYNGFYTSTAAMVLIMSYKCRVLRDLKDTDIDLTWQKAEAILQDMVSFSKSARNTLGFLQTIRTQCKPSTK
ncbi:hypothetical protein N7457_005221 [Penicillium paradoxum]|uniref:uncharacterized protein n=1 Tax=Penicillium paradoxum TaxID=176176 RepID=UPI0025483DA2|nr:uncharacterized protein N7457_005221 [Penicillium paradoxum]KAJ5780061.1 hypothetical protein N7457_005221 [Penicillium paradoxum]